MDFKVRFTHFHRLQSILKNLLRLYLETDGVLCLQSLYNLLRSEECSIKQPCLICSHEFFHVAVPHIPLLSTIPASCNEVLHREGFAENDLGIPDKQVGVKAGARGISMDHQHEKLKWQDQKRWSQISLQPDVQEHINDHL